MCLSSRQNHLIISRIDGGIGWFNRFDQEAISNELPKRGQKTQRVKIAVLDTGIDLNNAWIASKAGMIKCWPSIRECHDTDGHGTHVAYLLLRLAAHAELHVAKVSISQTLSTSDIDDAVKRIADVSGIFFSIPI